ncbi:MAG: hypothetical protein OHK0024_20620 [Thalassobaculales bacterium]
MFRPALSCLLLLALCGCSWFDWFASPPAPPSVTPAQARAIAYEVVRQAERDAAPRSDPQAQEQARRLERLEQRIDKVDDLLRRQGNGMAAPAAGAAKAEVAKPEPPPRPQPASPPPGLPDSELPQLHARIERMERRVVELQRQIDTVTPAPADPRRRGLHLASYRSHPAAMRGWETLSRKYRPALDGLEPTLVEVDTLGGHFVRLVTGLDLAAAKAEEICRAIRARGGYCAFVPVDG